MARKELEKGAGTNQFVPFSPLPTALTPITATIEAPLPTQAFGIGKAHEVVEDILAKHSLKNTPFTIYPSCGPLVLPVDKGIRAETACDTVSLPQNAARRYSHIVNQTGQDEILRHYRLLMALNPTIYGKHETRSDVPALHLGSWPQYMPKGQVTRDTRLEKAGVRVRKSGKWTIKGSKEGQNPAVVEQIDKLMCAVKKHLITPLERMVQREEPEMWERAQRYEPFTASHSVLIGPQLLRGYKRRHWRGSFSSSCTRSRLPCLHLRNQRRELPCTTCRP